MHPALRDFTRQFLAVATIAAAPVVLVAFLGLPASLGRHPGEALAALSSGAITPRNAASTATSTPSAPAEAPVVAPAAA